MDGWRIRDGESIIDAIIDAIRMRTDTKLDADAREDSTEYQDAMTRLSEVVEEVARNYVEQLEIARSYDG